MDNELGEGHNCGHVNGIAESRSRSPLGGRGPVEHHHERVVITRNGHDAAVLISAEDLAELEETLSVLDDPEALRDIREADVAYARGDVVRGADAVCRLRS